MMVVRSNGGLRTALAALVVTAALGLAACGGDDETTSTAEAGVSGATGVEGVTSTTSTTTDVESVAGDPEARAKQIASCLEDEGLVPLQNPGNSSLGEAYNIVVNAGAAIIHGYADDADAQKNLAKVEREAAQPSDVDQIGSVILEVRTSSVLDEADIEEARSASETCVS
jgi:hypothetical protein